MHLGPAVVSSLYLFHLFEEYFGPPGLWRWVESNLAVSFSHFHWLAVNIPFFGAVVVALVLAERDPTSSWLRFAVATHLALHATMHALHSGAMQEYSPGVVSGIVLCAPVAGALVREELRHLDRRPLLLGVVCGVGTFPPLIHAVVVALGPSSLTQAAA